MRTTINLFYLLAFLVCTSSCSTNKNSTMESNTIMEVTTFNINSDVDPIAFSNRDASVENDFTSNQSGFLKRQSGVDDKGNYVVVVYWKSKADAEASMKKFMSDASVSDYAQMINASTMKMSRYAIDKPFKAEEGTFVEIMSYEVKPDTDMVKFDVINQKVETDFTGKRKGFLQRLTGVNEEGKQIVAVYWLNKETSDASLEPFMTASISKTFMKEMDPSSLVMGRYNLLKQ